MSKWEDIPKWTGPVLQGLAFWIGYKSQLYRHWPLTEGAIVGEAVSILQGKLEDDDDTLECEKMYKEIGSGDGRTRADLVIMKGKEPSMIIEVKRNSAGKAQIDKDLNRLVNFKKHNSKVRCFLLLASQSGKPARFIDDKGKALRNELSLDDGRAKVRRACKAASSFEGHMKATYACLIEVRG